MLTLTGLASQSIDERASLISSMNTSLDQARPMAWPKAFDVLHRGSAQRSFLIARLFVQPMAACTTRSSLTKPKVSSTRIVRQMVGSM